MDRIDYVSRGVRWFFQKYGLIIVLIFSVLAPVLALILYSAGADWKALVGAIVTLISFVFLIQRQQLEEIQLTKELITDFNSRYNKLNDTLNDILRSEGASECLCPTQVDKVYDYFNLCAEEYLFYKRGFIYQEVWRAWTIGMGTYFQDPRIAEVWHRETKDSYYGIDSDPHFRDQTIRHARTLEP